MRQTPETCAARHQYPRPVVPGFQIRTGRALIGDSIVRPKPASARDTPRDRQLRQDTGVRSFD